MPAALGRIDHVGIVIDDMASARRFLTDTLGLSVDRELHLRERSLEVAFLSAGGEGVALELIEVADPEARRQRLGEGNAARIEHIAIEVGDLAGSIERLRARGVETTSDTPARTGSTLSFWTVPSSTDGVTYQIFARD